VDELAGTGRYAAVLGYPDIDGLAAAAPDGPGGAVIVDLAGRSDLRRRARAALAGRPVRTLAVGSTHGDPDGLQAGDGEESFLAPERMRELAAGWGPDGLTRFLEAAWQRQLPVVRGEIELLPADTRADIEAAYAEVFAGGCPLDHGHVLTVPEA
jgi:hypothetical protein